MNNVLQKNAILIGNIIKKKKIEMNWCMIFSPWGPTIKLIFDMLYLFDLFKSLLLVVSPPPCSENIFD